MIEKNSIEVQNERGEMHPLLKWTKKEQANEKTSFTYEI